MLHLTRSDVGITMTTERQGTNSSLVAAMTFFGEYDMKEWARDVVLQELSAITYGDVQCSAS